MEGAREIAWAVSLAGHRPTEVREDFAALVGGVLSSWRSIFPEELGYETQIQRQPSDESDEEGGGGVGRGERGQARVRVVVRRGDFQGELELCSERDRRALPRIRALAEARSQRELAAREDTARRVRWVRRAALSWGVTLAVAIMGLSFYWVVDDADMPLIGGLLLIVITASLVVGAAALGARIGESLVARGTLEIQRTFDEDPQTQADLRRWRSLERALRAQRRALSRGRSGGPFRRPAADARRPAAV
ncbi:hypothetical protein G6O69_21330 [Pseudenhygromyxa sp. WMMC2535]|uniref:hypothetical protein n=1 Tax=Pseudenhygromyxa sp. WMMC2535 TaxID=2712867 RepID=UPI001595977B|nr:hypothetical protein [Pseudenhygromyxa sp. WMMC2535]NVB40396.1 hypothetical protein [Pseudenhygromyxa sp. WMMC2535]